MIVFLIGAVVFSMVVLWRKYSWDTYLLGLLVWVTVSSIISLWSVINCACFLYGDPCPMMHVLCYPVSLQLFVIYYRCPGCVSYQLHFGLGGLVYWEVESPVLIGYVAQAIWLTQWIFPLLQMVNMGGGFVVFAIVWSARSAVRWFRKA